MFSDFYSVYRGKYADNRIDISIFPDDAAKVKEIEDLINATYTYIDAIL